MMHAVSPEVSEGQFVEARMPDGARFLIPPAPRGSRSSIPKVLYRRFTSREDAENFLRNGEIRFKSIAHYRRLEAGDARRDDHEGSVFVSDATGIRISIAAPGTTDYGSPIEMTGVFRKSLAYPETFLTSCYSFRRHRSQEKFGEWVVRIHRARAWLMGITENHPNPDALFWGRIAYFDPARLEHMARPLQLWLSKPVDFRLEYEFRIIMRLLHRELGTGEPVVARIVLGDMSDYADLQYDEGRKHE
jgi:hypothetical protein